MKSFLKLISLVSLILLLCTRLAGNNFIIKSLTTEPDTSDLSFKLRVDSFPLPIIAPSSGVQFFRDKVMFLSLTKNERKMTPNHISFGVVNAYYATILDSAEGKHVEFSPALPFSFPCEAVTFNYSFDTIYFTKLNDGKEKIFMARYASEGITMTGTLPVEFCTGNYNYSHPSLSADGHTMVLHLTRMVLWVEWICLFQGEQARFGHLPKIWVP